jgi:hypothetical protein
MSKNSVLHLFYGNVCVGASLRRNDKQRYFYMGEMTHDAVDLCRLFMAYLRSHDEECIAKLVTNRRRDA